jgi:hypothetical protein
MQARLPECVLTWQQEIAELWTRGHLTVGRERVYQKERLCSSVSRTGACMTSIIAHSPRFVTLKLIICFDRRKLQVRRIEFGLGHRLEKAGLYTAMRSLLGLDVLWDRGRGCLSLLVFDWL